MKLVVSISTVVLTRVNVIVSSELVVKNVILVWKAFMDFQAMVANVSHFFFSSKPKISIFYIVMFRLHFLQECDMCSNPAYNCDPESGRCVCPPNSKGIDCSQCMPNSYGYSHKKGCKFCDCDHGGSIGQSCDLYTGQCVCREGFTGRRCDECANGFFAYPRCERCNCNYDGSQLPTNSTDSIPCNENGQCTCKAFVAGLKCDSCIPSTFGLSHLNPDGCSKCFCFDRSTECRESDLSWGIIRATDVRYIGVEYQNTEFVTIQAFNKDQFITYEANLDLVNGLSIIPGTSGKFGCSKIQF